MVPILSVVILWPSCHEEAKERTQKFSDQPIVPEKTPSETSQSHSLEYTIQRGESTVIVNSRMEKSTPGIDLGGMKEPS